ncbi:MAG: hypothetical protein WAW69_19075 [Polaromonas sp.]
MKRSESALAPCRTAPDQNLDLQIGTKKAIYRHLSAFAFIAWLS